MTNREEMLALERKLRAAVAVLGPDAHRLEELVGINQNEGCGGDRSMSPAEWAEARDLAGAVLALDRALSSGWPASLGVAPMAGPREEP